MTRATRGVDVLHLMELFDAELRAGAMHVVQILLLTVKPAEELRFWLRFYGLLRRGIVMSDHERRKERP